LEPIKENLYEKFTDQSDPIKDMGIGARKIWKEHAKKINDAAPSRVYYDYFDDRKKPINRRDKCVWQKMYCLCDILKYLIKGNSPQIAFERACKKKANGIVDLVEGLYPSKYEIQKDIANALKKHFGIDINVNESVNEKFKEESDPIKDMKIGLYAHKDFDTPNKMYEFIVENLTAILDIDEIPENILNDPEENIFIFFAEDYAEQRRCANTLRKYIKDFVRVDGKDIFDWLDFSYVFKLKHPELKSWKYPDLNEKFSEEVGDPIRDMHIGGIERLKKILYSIPPGSCMDLYRLYYKKTCSKEYEGYAVPLVRVMYHTVKNLIEHPRITPQKSFEEITALEMKMKDYDDPKIRLKILTKVAEMLEIKFFLDVNPYFEKKNVNEKFVIDSDPIHDMGIGDIDWDDAKRGSIVRVKKTINQSHPKNSYVILNKIFRNLDGDITSVFYYSCDDLMDLRKSLKHLNKLVYHQWSLDKEFIEKYLEIVPNWKIKNLKESVNEKFSEEGDAIADMNIGANHFKEEIMNLFPVKYVHGGVDYIDYIRYVLFGDETTVEYDKNALGNTVYTIICKEYSKNKFFDEIEHMINVKGFKNDKGVAVDAMTRKLNRLTIVMADAHVNEKFSEEGDPVHSMGIGLYGPHDFKSQKAMDMFIAEMLSAILKIKNLPENILNDTNSSYYLYFKVNLESKLNRLAKYVQKYLTVNSKPQVVNYEQVHVALKKLHPELQSWMCDDKGNMINEKFKEDTDAIKDMGIGSGYRTIPLYGMTKFKPDKNDIESIEGNEVGDFFKKSGVTYKMKDEYKSGIAGLIFTGSEQALIHILAAFYNVDKQKAIQNRWIFKLRMNETFAEESDPIRDMRIGLLKIIQNYADKKVKEGDASWLSGPEGWIWEIESDPDLDEQTRREWTDFLKKELKNTNKI
jgi:hypothetical protein